MEDNQAKLLSLLAKKLKDEKRNNQEILKTFVSAGILNQKGEKTKNFSGLFQSANFER